MGCWAALLEDVDQQALDVDALDFCYTKSHIGTFVIISGDSDFSPLVPELRMASSVLKLPERGDWVLVLVEVNQKWVLDCLFEQTPEFKVDSSRLHLLGQ